MHRFCCLWVWERTGTQEEYGTGGNVILCFYPVTILNFLHFQTIRNCSAIYEMPSRKVFSNACDIGFREVRVFMLNAHHIKHFSSLFIIAIANFIHALDTLKATF